MRLLKLLVVLAVFFSLTVTVFAHPGRTDSQGGHTDHSTGEYHYHHGYSAHQHYDIDGDGEIDCPYDFKDLTGINSGESSETEYGVFAELDKIRQNQEARESELDSTESFDDMVARYKREQATSIPLPTTAEPLEKKASFSGVAKTAKDYAGEGIIFLVEVYIVVGSAWGLIRLIKSIFRK